MSGGGIGRSKRVVAALAAVAAVLAVISASAEAAPPPGPYVVVTPSPAVVPAPGGQVLFTVNVDAGTSAGSCGNCTAPTVVSLIDSTYGDLNGKGTCSVGEQAAEPIPYACTFLAEVRGGPGSSHADWVNAKWSSFQLPSDLLLPPITGWAEPGEGIVSITCKRGLHRKSVTTKKGETKKRCVRTKQRGA